MPGIILEKSRGLGLIEVLVTMLLLSTAILTLASLQSRSLLYNQGAYLRSQANILASDMLDRIRANKSAFASYNLSLSSFSGSAVTTPVAAADIYQWRKDVNSRIPSAKAGIVCVTATRICTVTIVWNEVSNTGLADETATTFNYASRIQEP